MTSERWEKWREFALFAWTRSGLPRHWPVILVVLLGLGLRLDLAWQYNQRQPDSPARLAGDEPGYNNTALELLNGHGYTWPGRVPLYPLWLAACHWASGTSYRAVPYAQAFLGSTSVLLTYVLGRRVFNRQVGLVAALLAAVSYVLVHHSLHFLSEVLFTPVLLLVALTLWQAFENPSAWRFLLVGAWIGISALIRPTLLFLPLFLYLALLGTMGFRRCLRFGTITVLSTLLVVSPWLVRNRIRHQAWFPLATSNAILWLGSPECYRLLRDQGYTYMEIWSKVLYGPGWREHDPMSVQGDRWWNRRALRSIGEEPLTYLLFAAEKLWTYWVGNPSADWNGERIFSYGALRRLGFNPQDAVAVIIARALPVVSLAAIAVLWKQRRRLLPIYSLLLYCTLLHAATHAEARLSEPLHPLLLVLVSGAGLARRQQAHAATTASLPQLRPAAEQLTSTRNDWNLRSWRARQARPDYGSRFRVRSAT